MTRELLLGRDSDFRSEVFSSEFSRAVVVVAMSLVLVTGLLYMFGRKSAYLPDGRGTNTFALYGIGCIGLVGALLLLCSDKDMMMQVLCLCDGWV